MDTEGLFDKNLDRVREQFPSFYLTLVTVIQGAILGYFVFILHSSFSPFNIDLHNMLLLIASFFMIVAIWVTYSLNSLVWRWIPGISDPLLVFAIGVAEFAVIRLSISGSVYYWYFSMAMIALLACLAFLNSISKAAKEPVNYPAFRDLEKSLKRIKIFHFGAIFFWVAGGVISWLLCEFNIVKIVMSALAIVLLLCPLILHIRHWQRFVTTPRHE